LASDVQQLSSLRPYQQSDLSALAALFRASSEADRTGEVLSEEQLAHILSLPGMEGERSYHLLHSADGPLSAAVSGMVRRLHQGAYFSLGVTIHPDHRSPDLYDALLAFEEQRGRSLGGTEWFQAYVDCRREDFKTAVGQRGYEPVRWFLELVCDLAEAPDSVPMPDGIAIRPFHEEQHVRPLHRTLHESFEDHWDPIDITEEQLRHYGRMPGASNALRLLAWPDDGECAGACVCGIRTEYNAQYGAAEGHVHVLGVRRAYRRRGLARALLAEGLRRMRDMGMTAASIEVDSESPTGADRLYGSVGFRERSRAAIFRKPLGT
jgi:ribosomal protein S18 acetylase RimI-like enzyme